MKGIASDGRVRAGCFGGDLMVLPGEPTEDTPYSRQVLRLLLDEDAIVPEIWAFEIANSIFYDERSVGGGVADLVDD